MRTINTLVLRDGFLCIRCVDSDYSEPQWFVRYYPICRCNPGLCEGFAYPMGHEMRDLGNGTYVCNDSSDSRRFELMNLGQTKPIAFEQIPAEKPKTKLPVRWQNGEWQRLLKTGWTWTPHVSIP